MRLGLFKSIYGRPGEGIFRDLYNMGGQAQPSALMSHNIRLGDGDTMTSKLLDFKVLGVPGWLVGLVLVGLFVLKRKK